MLVFAFLRGGFSIHCHSANEEGVPVPSKPFMAQGQNNRRLARWKAHFDLCRVDLVFRMSRASLLARLPLYCSAECATPKNSLLFANFSRNLANAPLPPESFRTCFVCATHAHSHFCPQHWLLCHLGLYYFEFEFLTALRREPIRLISSK